MSVFVLIVSVAAASANASPVTVERVAESASMTTMRAAPAAKAPSAKTQYCVRATSTGSRIKRKICHTRDDWLIYGFDPLNPNA